MPRATKLGGHAIEQHDSPNQGGAMSGHRGVVLHIAEGTYRGTISWQNNPNQEYRDGTKVTTCSTWIVGRAEGEWAQMVDSSRIAWCQRDGSRTWLSIELAGYAPNPPTAWQIEACAQLLVWAHITHGIPVAIADHPDERGIGHHSMDREWLGEEWGHDSCPGSGVIGAKSAIAARARAILAGEDDDMAFDELQEARLNAATERGKGAVSLEEVVWVDPRDGKTKREPNKLAAAVLRIEAGLAALSGRDWVDEDTIVSGVLAGFGSKPLDEAAAALQAALGPERAAELGRLLAGSGS